MNNARLQSSRQDRTLATPTVERVLLLVGFCAVAIGVAIAHSSPATAYEISIYAATPVGFWIAIGVAFACSLLVAFFPATRTLRLGALLLGGEAFLSVVGLEVIRGYAFNSSGDALTHVGWIKDVFNGTTALTELTYPGLHTIGIVYHRVLGIPLERGLLLGVFTFVVLFVIFVPLAIRTVTGDRFAATVGAFSAMMLLPINNISAHLTVFPSTMAIFFLPFVLTILLVYLTRSNRDTWASTTGVFLALASATMVLVHPQQATNLLLFFATIAGMGLVTRRVWNSGTELRPLYSQTAFLAVVLVAWGASHERVTDAVMSYSTNVFTTFFASAPESTSTIGSQTGSLTAIGASLAVVFLKLFLISTIYLGLTGLLTAGSLFGRLPGRDERLRMVRRLVIALIPIGVVMAVYLVASLQDIYFRHMGFIMALVTIFGAIAIARGVERAPLGSPRNIARSVALVAVAAMLVLSLATVFSSPFIYQANSHVTDMRFSGHDTAFTYENESVSYVGVRSGPDRFRDAHQGTGELASKSERVATGVPFHGFNGSLTETYDDQRYLIVTEADIQREATAYREYRYSERGMRTVGTEPGVNRVVSNGDFELYLVDE